jgi:hypothetical protein
MNEEELVALAKALLGEGKTEEEVYALIKQQLLNQERGLVGSAPTTVPEPPQVEPVLPIAEDDTATVGAEEDLLSLDPNQEPYNIADLYHKSEEEAKVEFKVPRDAYNLAESGPQILNEVSRGLIDRQINVTKKAMLNYMQEKSGKDISFKTYSRAGVQTNKKATISPEDAIEKLLYLNQSRELISESGAKQELGKIGASNLSEWEKSKAYLKLALAKPSLAVDISASSMAQSPEAVLLATLGAFGGVWGLAIGTMIGTYSAEEANAFTELLEFHNIDTSNIDDLRELASNPDLQAKILGAAHDRGVVMAATEVIFTAMTLGMNKLAPKGLIGKLGKRALQTGTEIGSEGVSETAGRVAAGMPASASEATLEMIGAGKGLVDASLAMSLDTSKAALGVKDKPAVAPNSIEGMMAAATAEVAAREGVVTEQSESSMEIADKLTNNAAANTDEAVNKETGEVEEDILQAQVTELMGDDVEAKPKPKVEKREIAVGETVEDEELKKLRKEYREGQQETDDIERRRQEELNSIRPTKASKFTKLFGEKDGFEYQQIFKGSKGIEEFKTFKQSISKEEAITEINAKYDAESKAVEQSQPAQEVNVESTKKEPKKEGMSIYAAGRAIEGGLEFSSTNNSIVSRDLDKARKTGNTEAIAGMEAWQAKYKAEQDLNKEAKATKIAKEKEVANKKKKTQKEALKSRAKNKTNKETTGGKTNKAKVVEVAKKKEETTKKKTKEEATKAREAARKSSTIETPVALPNIPKTVPASTPKGPSIEEFNKRNQAWKDKKEAKKAAIIEEDNSFKTRPITEEEVDQRAKNKATTLLNKQKTGKAPKTPKQAAQLLRDPLEAIYKRAFSVLKVTQEAANKVLHNTSKEIRTQRVVLAQAKLDQASSNLRALRARQHKEGVLSLSTNYTNFEEQTTAQLAKLGKVAINELNTKQAAALARDINNGGEIEFANDFRASRAKEQKKARSSKFAEGNKKQVRLKDKDGKVHTTLDGDVKVLPSIQAYFTSRLEAITEALNTPNINFAQKAFYNSIHVFLRNFITSDFLTTITELQKKQGNLALVVVEANEIETQDDNGSFITVAGLFSSNRNMIFVSRNVENKNPLSIIETTIHELMHAVQMIMVDAINNSDIKLKATESLFKYTKAVNGVFEHKDFQNTFKILDIMDRIVKLGNTKDIAKQLKELGASDSLITLIISNNHTDLFANVYSNLSYALSETEGNEVLSHIADPYVQFILSNINSTEPTAKSQSIFSKLINQFVNIYHSLGSMFSQANKDVLESSIYNTLQAKLDAFINEMKVSEITEAKDELLNPDSKMELKVGDKVKTIALKMESMQLKDEVAANRLIDAYNKRAGKGKGVTLAERAAIIKLLDFGGNIQSKNLVRLHAILSAKLTKSKRKKKVSTNKAEAQYIAFIEYINYLRDPANGFTVMEIVAAQNKILDSLELTDADKKTGIFTMFSKLASSDKFKAIETDYDWKLAAFEIAKFETLSSLQQTEVLAALELASVNQKIKIKIETAAQRQRVLDNKNIALKVLTNPLMRLEHTVYKTGMIVKAGQRIKSHLTYYVMAKAMVIANKKELIDNAASTQSVVAEGLDQRVAESKKGFLNKWRALILYGTGVDTIIETLTQRFGTHTKAYNNVLAHLGDDVRHGFTFGFIALQKALSIEITEKQTEFFGGKEKSRQKQLAENRELRDFTYNGSTIKMTYNQAYKKWMEFQNPEARKRMELHNYGVEYEAALEAFVPPQVLEYAAWQLNEFYPNLYVKINEVYKRVYGVNLVKRDFYSPIYTQTQASALDTNSNVLDFQGNLDEISNSGLLELTTTNEMPATVDGDQSLMTHVQRMSYFIGMAEPVSMFKAVFADHEVKSVIATYHNPEINNTLKYFMDLMTRGGYMQSHGQTAKNIDSIRKTFTVGALGANLTLIPKQLMSFAAYTSEMPVGEFAAATVSTIAKLASGDKKLYDWIKNNEYIKIRWGGNIERDLADVMHSVASSKLAGTTSFLNTIKVASMFPTRVGDLGAVIVGGYGLYLQLYESLIKEGKTATEAELTATKAFAKVTEMAQQSSNINDMSILQTDSSFGRLFTMFLSTPILYWRMAHTAMSDLALAVGGSNIPRARLNDSLKRVLVFHFALPALFTFAAQGFMLQRDEDDPEKYDSFGMGTTAFTGAIAGVPVLGGVLQYVINKSLLGKNYQFTGSPVFSNIVKLAGVAPGYFEKVAELTSANGQTMESMLNDMTTADVFGVAEDAAVLLQSFGYGVTTPLRTLKSFAMSNEWEKRGMEVGAGYYFQAALGYGVEEIRKNELTTNSKGGNSGRGSGRSRKYTSTRQ